ncbi:hypothetical protein BgiMline_017573, partial [Biomphalaria glabrata]
GQELNKISASRREDYLHWEAAMLQVEMELRANISNHAKKIAPFRNGATLRNEQFASFLQQIDLCNQ